MLFFYITQYSGLRLFITSTVSHWHHMCIPRRQNVPRKLLIMIDNSDPNGLDNYLPSEEGDNVLDRLFCN